MQKTGILSGRGRAIVLVCALGIPAAPPAGGTAYADPKPPRGGLEDVRKKIEKLHDDVESAAEAHNRAQEKVEKQQKAIVVLARKIDRLQSKQRRMTATAGAMARAQYRAGGMSDEARLVLGGDPESFLRGAARVRQGQKAARGFLAELGRHQTRLDAYVRQATAEREDLEGQRKKKAAAEKEIAKRLKAAERTESRLAAEEREQLRALEEAASSKRQAKWLDSVALEEIDGKASKAGKRALSYATQQIGKDYEWGAEGPMTFDCSGLTLRAWQAAGVEIPRTSQEQWKQLPRVPVRKMRPGDLVIFKRDASHVGMYVGDGAMVHAPRTGRQITVEGAGSLPVLGVVRPDK